ncbi:response regulator [Stutzerimonas zhaodongensis]|uniref:response regulator n=1 Tax=Stutzerimonas zhaodongensis TaxID=1176257 RepID=UPI00313CACF8
MHLDLLLTDVGLPGGMNGLQLANAGQLARPDLRVLFITGYAENALFHNGLLEPGMSVLSKPFSVNSLAERMRELIGQPPAHHG